MRGNTLVYLPDLLKEIDRIAALPQDEATSMPPEAFTSSELLALERERIFSKEWICVGREDELLSREIISQRKLTKCPLSLCVMRKMH